MTKFGSTRWATAWAESETGYDVMRTPHGLEQVAESADAIGPWLMYAYELARHDDVPIATGLVREAKSHGLAVHPYTFRADDLPRGFANFAELVRFFAEELEVDGLFTDHADRAVRVVKPAERKPKK